MDDSTAALPCVDACRSVRNGTPHPLPPFASRRRPSRPRSRRCRPWGRFPILVGGRRIGSSCGMDFDMASAGANNASNPPNAFTIPTLASLVLPCASVNATPNGSPEIQSPCRIRPRHSPQFCSILAWMHRSCKPNGELSGCCCCCSHGLLAARTHNDLALQKAP